MNLSPQILESSGEKYALIIGINSCRDSSIPPLRYALNDALALRDFLIHPEMGKFKKENVHMLLDAEATVGDIRSQFVYWLGAQVREQDQVWLFFAGRGTTDFTPALLTERPFENYLVAHDTLRNDLANTAISIQQLHEWLELVVAGRVIMFFDCGFSPVGKGRTLATNKGPAMDDYVFLPNLTGNRGRLVLVAAGATEAPLEDNDLEHGLFSGLLLQRLRLAATKEKAGLTFDDLFHHLAAEVSRYAGVRGAVQNPVKIGNLTGDFVLLQGAPQLHEKKENPAEKLTREKIDALFREAQKEIHADNLARAYELLREILAQDPGNRRASTGIQKIEETIENQEREAGIQTLFAEARRYLDEKNYHEALRCYQSIQELDPNSESARLGIESCEAFVQKQQQMEDWENPPAAPAPDVPKLQHTHRLKPYDHFIWPYIGWWALLGCVWGTFGTHTDTETSASTFVNIVKFGAYGMIAGFVHGSLYYLFKKLMARSRRLKKMQPLEE